MGMQLEALALCLRGLLNPRQTPDLEGPKYTVLRDTGDYQVHTPPPYYRKKRWHICVALVLGSASHCDTNAGSTFGDNLMTYIIHDCMCCID